MEQIDLLLVGDAADGPEGELIRVRSLDQAARLFGAWAYQTVTVASGSTGVTLSPAPWGGSAEPLAPNGDAVLVPSPLFELAVSGAVASWTPPGTGRTVYFRILERPGDTSLFRGILAVEPLLREDLRVYALRIGGTHATAGPSGGFAWSARYPGNRYNGATVVVSGGRVTVTPTPGTGRQRRYHPTSDAQLQLLLQDDLARGYQPYLLSGPTSQARLTVPSGTYTFAGGANGTLTASGVAELIREYDLDGVDVLCPVGLSTVALSGDGVLDLLADSRYPTLLVAQAPVSGVALSGLVNASRFLVSVGFQGTFAPGTPREWQGDAAPYVAARLAGRRYGSTRAPLDLATQPFYAFAALSAGADAGHTLPTRSISAGPVLYRAVTGDPDWPVSTFRAFQALARALFLQLEPLIGETLVDLSPLRTALGRTFAELTDGTVPEWSLDRVGETLYLELLFQPPGEVRTLSARLALGSVPGTAANWPL